MRVVQEPADPQEHVEQLIETHPLERKTLERPPELEESGSQATESNPVELVPSAPASAKVDMKKAEAPEGTKVEGSFSAPSLTMSK